MKERFKQYLEEHFRKIAPTQASMEYRKTLLRQLLDREQELRIKGVSDDELIFNMAVSELGDLDTVLHEFENRQVKSGEVKRKVSAYAVIAISIVALLTVAYLIVGGVTKMWSPTWLIMVGGVFAGVTVVLAYLAVKFFKKHKPLVSRACIAVCEVLLTVFVFLVLQVAMNITGSWLAFLAMVVLVFGVDTAIAFATNSKTKWFELPVFVEVFGVMLYVTLGICYEMGLIIADSFWHPTWLMCLVGVVCALVQIIVAVAKKTAAKNKKEKLALSDKNEKTDEKYWTEWDD